MASRHPSSVPSATPEQRLRALVRPVRCAPAPEAAADDGADLPAPPPVPDGDDGSEPPLIPPPPPPYAVVDPPDRHAPESAPKPVPPSAASADGGALGPSATPDDASGRDGPHVLPPPAAPVFWEEPWDAGSGGAEPPPAPARSPGGRGRDRRRGDGGGVRLPPPEEPPPGYVRLLPSGPAERRLPAPLAALLERLPFPGGEDRPRLGASGVFALAAVCLLAAGATGWFMVAARPASAPAPPVPSPAASPSAAGAGGTVVVHVGGEVESPGVVTLPAGSRVADAIEAAGGLLPDADPGLLNLARPLVDGEQVLVGVTPPPAPSPGQAAPGGGVGGGTIDLNTATAEQLQTLPGIGPVLARRIVDYRTSHGGFTSVEQLRDVTGIGDRRFEELRGLVHVGGVS